MITSAMKRNFEYERTIAKQCFSKKGGRPSAKTAKTRKGPKNILLNTDEFGKKFHISVISCVRPIIFVSDSVSYVKHVERMLEMISKDGD